MKKINYQIFASTILSLVLFSSCVSQKRYNEAVDELVRLRIDSTMMEAELADQEYALRKKISEQQNALTLTDQERRIAEAELDYLNQYTDRIETILSPSYKDLPIVVSNGKITLGLSNEVLFDVGESQVKSDAQNALAELARLIDSEDIKSELIIVGHTDSQPYPARSTMDNWQLSADRALAVTKLLIIYGIDPENIMAAGKSKYEPQASNTTAAGRQLNRRTEIIITPQFEEMTELLLTDY
jgi:chemotaxis protein MotB